LKCPPEFFHQSGRIVWTVCLHHRKRQSMPVTRLKMIHAQVNIARMQVVRFMRGIKIDSPLTFPRMDIAGYESPEQVARLATGHWWRRGGEVESRHSSLWPANRRRVSASAAYVSELG
jgi:hypothetical protein